MLSRRLITRRFIIRRFSPSDREYLAAAYKKRKHAMRYLDFPRKMKTREGVLNLLDTVCALYDSDTPIHTYAIALRAYAVMSSEEQTYVGSCGFAPEGGTIRFYWDAHRTEASVALLRAVRSKDNAAEIKAYVNEAKEWSVRIARNLGLTDELVPLPFLMQQIVYQLSPSIIEL